MTKHGRWAERALDMAAVSAAAVGLRLLCAFCLLCGLAVTTRAHADERPPRVLFLTHAAGYEHAVIKRPAPEQLSVAEAALVSAAGERFTIVPSKDCSLISEESLAGFDAVVFYTTGDLPLAEGGAEALRAFVRKGGGFVGVHCATDTLDADPLYREMIGGHLDGHPWHQEVALRVEDRRHKATAHLGESVRLTDEIYQFEDFSRFPVNVLLSLDTSSVDVASGKRTDGDYALAWCREYGEGRVFYTALGHRAELWADGQTFLPHLLGGLDWALHGPQHSPQAPAGAVVLYDGGGRSEPDIQSVRAVWRQRTKEGFTWSLVPDGDGVVMEVAPTWGDLLTDQQFADGLLHLEFKTPDEPQEIRGQARGNSGVFLQGRYEVQVLESYGLEVSHADCGAIYGKHAPLRNASRPAESWQSFDIRFQAPRFDEADEKTSNARMSVWHNGLLIHDDVEVDGPTRSSLGPEAPTGPLMLQDHGTLVRFRNIWFLPASGHTPR